MSLLRITCLLLALSSLGGCAAAPEAAVPAGWKLVWSDEFNGTELDRSKWDFEAGNGFYLYEQNQWIPGWGNRELEYYTRSSDNVFVQDGVLHLRARKEAHDGFGYTSGRLATRGRDGADLFSKTYGRFEFRAQLPVGQGLWPALWLLPRDTKYGGWPASGEIDIVEARGQIPTTVNGTAHFDQRFNANAAASAMAFEFPAGQSIAQWHVYALEWEPGVLRWLVDGQVFRTMAFWWSASRLASDAKGAQERLNAWPAPFDQPFYLIMNLAVGGDYLGNPDASTRFPAEMLLDYVRVYDRVGGYATAAPRAPGALPAGLREGVKVMSYNIRCGSCERADDPNHWSRRQFLVADVIRKSGADVIGLQEAEAFQVQDLAALLKDFAWVGVGRDDGALQGEMNAVLVRRSAFDIASSRTLWLSPTPEQVSRGWDAMLKRTLTAVQLKSRTTGKTLHLLNTHFDHMGATARDESARLVAQTVQALDGGGPVIVTGDLNAHADFAGYRTLTQPLRDAALSSRTPAAGGDISFNGFGKDLQPHNKIDYVFVSPDQQVLSHRIVTDTVNGLYPSDHFPVVVDVLLP